VDVVSIAYVSEIHAASIFRVKVSEVRSIFWSNMPTEKGSELVSGPEQESVFKDS
jgi:hypothetical protein